MRASVNTKPQNFTEVGTKEEGGEVSVECFQEERKPRCRAL